MSFIGFHPDCWHDQATEYLGDIALVRPSAVEPQYPKKGAHCMHVLLTRPSFQAELVRALLEQRGCTVTIEPVLNVSSASPSLDALRGADIFVVTSVYASLHIVNANFLTKSTPIFAVGGGTAAPLRQAGFSQVFQADGDAKSLLELILKEIRRKTACLFPAARA